MSGSLDREPSNAIGVPSKPGGGAAATAVGAWLPPRFAENSEVAPEPLVTVAVKIWRPARPTGKTAANEALPDPSVITGDRPR